MEIGIENLGAMKGLDIEKIADADNQEEKYKEDIKKRSAGHPGAASVLGELLKEGPEIYDEVVPKLNKSGIPLEIWEAYTECDKDIKVLIERYGGK